MTPDERRQKADQYDLLAARMELRPAGLEAAKTWMRRFIAMWPQATGWAPEILQQWREWLAEWDYRDLEHAWAALERMGPERGRDFPPNFDQVRAAGWDAYHRGGGWERTEELRRLRGYAEDERRWAEQADA